MQQDGHLNRLRAAYRLARLLAAGLAAAVVTWVVPAASRELRFVRLAVPQVGRITHVTGEDTDRIWLLSEELDVLVVQGQRARRVRDGSWAIFEQGAGSYRFFNANAIAAADSALIVAGSHVTPLSNSFTAFARIPLQGRFQWWSALSQDRPLTARVQLGSIAPFSDSVQWASGGRTYVGQVTYDPDNPLFPETPSRIWTTNEEGILLFDGWTWKTIELEAMPDAVWFEGSRAIWVLMNGSVRVLRDGGWTRIPTPEPFPAVRMKGTRTGRVWFFGPEFLAVCNGDQILPVKTPMHEVLDLWQTSDGKTYLVGSGSEAGSAAVSLLDVIDLGGL